MEKLRRKIEEVLKIGKNAALKVSWGENNEKFKKNIMKIFRAIFNF
jgi:23S rRNA U2552 (ribose-2'-O)-methylase RlmE/FtsJ